VILQVVINGVCYTPQAPNSLPAGTPLRRMLEETRQHLGWTLEEASGQIGCSRGSLHRYESGQDEPGLRMAYRISKAYGLSLDAMAEAMPERRKEARHQEQCAKE
jgi:transcriptional regulator with XRE-family HTH domain